MRQFSTIVVLIGLLTSSASHGAAVTTYTCTLKARVDVMNPFEQVSATFDGDNPMEVTVLGFRMRMQNVIVDGESRNAMWLGQDSGHSAVTMAKPSQESLYLNLLQDEQFAVGECLAQP